MTDCTNMSATIVSEPEIASLSRAESSIADTILAAVDDSFGKVQPLGHKGGVYFFISAAGEFRNLQVATLCSYPGLASLFGGDLAVLEERFPLRDRRNSTSFSANEAGAGLIRACEEKGIFDGSVVVRGRGVWRGPDDSVIVHCGDELWVDGKWRGAGLQLGKAIYPAASRIARPAKEPADVEVARELRNVISNSWRFAHEGAAEIIVGFIGQALLGAYPRWRAHILLTGERGAGKTSLTNLVAAVLGDFGSLNNDASEAGLRQDQSSDVRAIIVDEAEGSSGGPSVSRVIELIRRMSSGQGAVGVRGSVGGTSIRFQVIGSAFLAGINPPDLKSQDRSRFTEIELRKLDSDGDHAAVLAATERGGTTTAPLWSRVLQGRDRYQTNFDTWRKVLLEHGCDARQAEQPASLLAAYFMLVEDAPIAEATARAELSRYAWMIQTIVGDEDESSPRQCLAHLLATIVDVGRNYEKKTIGQLLVEVERDSGSTHARAALELHGIRVAERSPDGLASGFYVANKNPSLKSIFRGSDWAADGWGRELKRIPGAGAHKNPISIAGALSRVTFVPRIYLPSSAEDTPS